MKQTRNPGQSLFAEMSEQVPFCYRGRLSKYFETKSGFIVPPSLFFYLVRNDFAGGTMHRAVVEDERGYAYMLPQQFAGVLVLLFQDSDQETRYILELYEACDLKRGVTFKFFNEPVTRVVGSFMGDARKENDTDGVYSFSTPNVLPMSLQFEESQKLFQASTAIQKTVSRLVAENEVAFCGSVSAL